MKDIINYEDNVHIISDKNLKIFYKNKELDLFEFAEVIRANERKKVLEEIRLEKKRISKKYSTDERRYPHGYNQAINDLEKLKSKL